MNLPVNINYGNAKPHLKYQYYTKAETDKLLTAGYEEGFTSLKISNLKNITFPYSSMAKIKIQHFPK